MKNSFENLQKKLNSVPESLYHTKPEIYKEICSQIFKNEGWDEEEYMGTVIGLLDTGKVQCGQIVPLNLSLNK